MVYSQPTTITNKLKLKKIEWLHLYIRINSVSSQLYLKFSKIFKTVILKNNAGPLLLSVESSRVKVIP